ncbi:unnamed protein product [Bemisia tabaci]|uniref:SP18.3 n=1 Tax=Bemisia tabaci TaxID=7038 RepID=A0A7S5HGR8_BEMTA|nr:SP18.3 [Bemisia tabaci]CAH0383822.1 unnamed protein product [Bemisia tabaci]
MQKSLVSLILALAIAVTSVTGSPAGGLTTSASPGPVNIDTIKSGLEKAAEKVGMSPEAIAQMQRDPHATVLSAMSHLTDFLSTTATKAATTAQASVGDLLQTTKNLAGDHIQALKEYGDAASTAGLKAAETTRDLFTKSYPNAIGLPPLTLNAKGSGGFTGFGI